MNGDGRAATATATATALGARSAVRKVAHLSPEERVARGKAARNETPRSSHGAWEPGAHPAGPGGAAGGAGREPGAGAGSDPVRADAGLAVHVLPRCGVDHGRRPGRHATSGLNAQLCGDAHLSNFGVFASPERQLMFDINDFDETLPGPWEWDVKRLAASFEIAGRDRGFTAAERRGSCWPPSRSTGRGCSGSPACGISTSGTPTSRSTQMLRAQLKAAAPPSKQQRQGQGERGQGPHPGQHAGVLQAHPRGRRRAPDHRGPAADRPGRGPAAGRERHGPSVEERAAGPVRSYRRTLETDRRQLLEQFDYVHAARKVVGVGSVGTRAWIVLLLGRDDSDPLFLQAKEAQDSVLERLRRAGASTPTRASASWPASG